MNWLDVVLVGILAASIVSGLKRGLIRTAFAAAASLLAMLLSIWFYTQAAAVVREYASSQTVANVVGFALVFVGVVIAGAVLGGILARVFQWAGLGWLDRILGGVFGLARGLVIAVGVVLASMAFALNPPPKSVVDSKLAPYVLESSRIAARLAPAELAAAVDRSYAKIREIWAVAWKEGLAQQGAGKRE